MVANYEEGAVGMLIAQSPVRFTEVVGQGSRILAIYSQNPQRY
jgi:hypothetical protein